MPKHSQTHHLKLRLKIQNQNRDHPQKACISILKIRAMRAAGDQSMLSDLIKVKDYQNVVTHMLKMTVVRSLQSWVVLCVIHNCKQDSKHSVPNPVK